MTLCACRNPGLLADILHRYSSIVDTGIILLQSTDVSETIRRTESDISVDAVFFTHIHFDIFGLFFPSTVHDLDSATKLLMTVYGTENLTLCVSNTELSSSSTLSSSSSLTNQLLKSDCSSAVRPSTEQQWIETSRQQRTTLRRSSLAFYKL